jgi:hypothetical protein
MDARPSGNALLFVLASRVTSSEAQYQIFQKTRDCQTIAGFLLNQRRPGGRPKRKKKT